MQSPSERKARRELRETRQQLKSLVDHVGGFLLYMDSVMAGKSNAERGKAIASACNNLDMSRQIAERYGLGHGLWRSKR